MNIQPSNIRWHEAKVSKQDRHFLNQHKSCVLWFTGLSGAGKSSLSIAVEKVLYDYQIRSYVLDGDNIRYGLSNNLGFSPADRKENIRRIGEVSKLFVDAGLFTITAFISPYREDRSIVREMFEGNEFVEIYVKCSLEECERRDPKGLYRKARIGEIKDFTGISAPYEEPLNAEIVIENDKQSLEMSVDQIITYLKKNRFLKSN
ncbi:MAG: adenylyl-sulfate kinase [Candidatus Cohnella colombiensis]|uniref:Adenylyl-sulfate kinase n=1 Tax=Candidatus Cohnella colombiensis TaxID=3121368 RepID=A0AA95EV25_9BACL|nr:MAG: adenylyl-sulfate kinase [Cohnella sp.]